jgi:hypothetical protein
MNFEKRDFPIVKLLMSSTSGYILAGNARPYSGKQCRVHHAQSVISAPV